MNKLLEVFGKNLKRLRKEKGFNSQTDLAKNSDVNFGVIKRSEEFRGLPEVSNISKLASALGVKETDLFFDAENPSEPFKSLFKKFGDYSQVVNALEKYKDVLALIFEADETDILLVRSLLGDKLKKEKELLSKKSKLSKKSN